LIRVLSEKYHYTPQQIGDLTPYQAFILCGAYCPEDGRLRLNEDQAKIWKKRKRAQSHGV